MPNWKDWAPRFSTVYDLFGNGKTALKYSLNRYNQSRTTGIAADLQPAALADVGRAALARPQRRRHRAGLRATSTPTAR